MCAVHTQNAITFVIFCNHLEAELTP
jgi:hypothetical protein